MKDLKSDQWIRTSEQLPEKPGLKSYEHVDCWIYVNNTILQRPWNCEHLCWDDEEYDDFEFEAKKPTHWMPFFYPEPPTKYHTKCHDCGKWLAKILWVPITHRWKKHALCLECLNNYDDIRDQ